MVYFAIVQNQRLKLFVKFGVGGVHQVKQAFRCDGIAGKIKRPEFRELGVFS